jgi:hypothetical protein
MAAEFAREEAIRQLPTTSEVQAGCALQAADFRQKTARTPV